MKRLRRARWRAVELAEMAYWSVQDRLAAWVPNGRAARRKAEFDADVRRLMAHPDLGGIGPREFTPESREALRQVLAKCRPNEAPYRERGR